MSALSGNMWMRTSTNCFSSIALVVSSIMIDNDTYISVLEDKNWYINIPWSKKKYS